MKKKTIITLLIAFILVVNVTFSYMLMTVDTNNVTIRVGQPDEGVATLTSSQGTDYVLIPLGSIATKTGETKSLDYVLNVQTSTSRSYTISHNLPSEFNLISTNPNGDIFQTNINYTLVITMTSPVTVDTVFYITIEFI